MAASSQDVPGALIIRPMEPEDVPVAERISDEGFHELDQRTFQRDWPDPSPRSAERSRSWIRRNTRMLAEDRGGCWVAESRDASGASTSPAIVGFATSHVREKLWVLASFAVRPGLQGQGVGAQLMAAALQHGQGCLRGMLAASADPRAVRRYRLAGFSLHPQMFLQGVVDRSAIAVVRHVREGGPDDIDLLDSIDRQTRGAAHGWQHEVLLSDFRLIVSERTTGDGYAYVDGTGSPVLVASTSRRTAADLVWEAFAASAPDGTVSVHHITAANEWAIDVGLAARLSVHTSGYLGVRNMKPPAPYVHHGSLL